MYILGGTKLIFSCTGETTKKSHAGGRYKNKNIWPSGLRRCYQDRKVPGSNPARRLAGLGDPTSLRGSW